MTINANRPKSRRLGAVASLLARGVGGLRRRGVFAGGLLRGSLVGVPDHRKGVPPGRRGPIGGRQRDLRHRTGHARTDSLVPDQRRAGGAGRVPRDPHAVPLARPQHRGGRSGFPASRTAGGRNSKPPHGATGQKDSRSPSGQAGTDGESRPARANTSRSTSSGRGPATKPFSDTIRLGADPARIAPPGARHRQDRRQRANRLRGGFGPPRRLPRLSARLREGQTRGSVADRRKNLLGFILGVFRPDEMLEAALAKLQPEGIDVCLYDPSVPGRGMSVPLPCVAGPQAALEARRFGQALRSERHAPSRQARRGGASLDDRLSADARLRRRPPDVVVLGRVGGRAGLHRPAGRPPAAEHRSPGVCRTIAGRAPPLRPRVGGKGPRADRRHPPRPGGGHLPAGLGVAMARRGDGHAHPPDRADRARCWPRRRAGPPPRPR